ncbi:MAG: BrnT family toxin [Candidatus Limnocylindrales bacterium]|nr:BrnT family toxin [Candidatus Limnocylindrales bacterium]
MSRYTWHPEKALENVAKHGVTFEDAETVDLDPNRQMWPDLWRDPDDERFAMVGYSIEGKMLLVITSERGPRPRIITARRATKRERHAYETRS